MTDNYKHIIWDWNGTLLDDAQLCVWIINKILTDNNVRTITLDQYREIFTFPVKEYYIKAGLDLNKNSFEALGQIWIDEYERHRMECNLHNGAKEILDYVAGKAITQSILSAYSQHTLEEIISHFELDSYFLQINGLDHIYATTKIHLGLKMLEDMSHGEKEILLIGDTIHDYEVANEMGIDCILVSCGHQSKEKLEGCGVPVINNLIELKNYI